MSLSKSFWEKGYDRQGALAEMGHGEGLIGPSHIQQVVHRLPLLLLRRLGRYDVESGVNLRK